MRLLRRLAAGLRALVRRPRYEQELDRELRAFLDIAIDEKMRAGASRQEAERTARAEMGSIAAVKDRVREAGWEAGLESVWQDVRYGARMLRRSPVFTAVAIGLLTLGIGASAAIFTVLNVVLLRPLPVRDPSTLVEPLSRYPGDARLNGFSWDFFEYSTDRNTVFTDVIGVAPAQIELRGAAGRSETVRAEYVVGTLFQVLGVEPAIGRLIGPEDAVRPRHLSRW